MYKQTTFKVDSYRRQSGASKTAKMDVSIHFHALCHLDVSVESYCTVAYSCLFKRCSFTFI